MRAAAVATAAALCGARGAGGAATDWCPYVSRPEVQAWLNGGPEIDWSTQLSGLTLTAKVHEYVPYIVRNGTGWSGRDIEIAESLAHLGNFSISYSESDTPESTGRPWSEIIVTSAKECDFISRWWVDTYELRDKGVQFMPTFHNADAVLLIPVITTPAQSLWTNAFYWVQPYHFWAWLVLAGIWLFTSIIVFAVERAWSGKSINPVKVTAGGWLTIQGYGDLSWPASPWGRAVLLFHSVAVLVITASYTANLTTFLVTKNVHSVPVKSMSDFVSRDMVACIQHDDDALYGMAKQLHPRIRLYKAVPRRILQYVDEGSNCQGVIVTGTDARIIIAGGGAPGDKAPRPDSRGCKLSIVQSWFRQGGAFPLGGAGAVHTQCSWFAHYALSSLFRRLREVQNVGRPGHTDVVLKAEESMLQQVGSDSNGSHVCGGSTTGGAGAAQTSLQRLSEESLLGLVIVTVSPTALVGLAGVLAGRVRYRRRKQAARAEREADAAKAQPAPAGGAAGGAAQPQWAEAAEQLRRVAEMLQAGGTLPFSPSVGAVSPLRQGGTPGAMERAAREPYADTSNRNNTPVDVATASAETDTDTLTDEASPRDVAVITPPPGGKMG